MLKGMVEKGYSRIKRDGDAKFACIHSTHELQWSNVIRPFIRTRTHTAFMLDQIERFIHLFASHCTLQIYKQQLSPALMP